MIKRVVDLVVSIVGLFVGAPVLAVIALSIVVVDGRPVMFRQERVGLNGRRFKIHKFRTMAVGHGGPNVSASGDARVTAIGALLRKSKLDEIPQLYDVLRGAMSLVGPRPEVPEYVDKWPAERRDLILSVRPGITDPASIEFRNEADLLAAVDDPASYYEEVILPRKVQMYAEYIGNRSFTGDVKLIMQTLGVIARG